MVKGLTGARRGEVVPLMPAERMGSKRRELGRRCLGQGLCVNEAARQMALSFFFFLDSSSRDGVELSAWNQRVARAD